MAEGQEEVLRQGSSLEEEANSHLQEEGDFEDKSKFEKKDIIKYAAIGSAVLIVGIAGLYGYSKMSGGSSDNVDVSDSGSLFEEVSEVPVSYDDDTREALRAAGYTGYEIEEFSENNVDADEKIAEAEAEREQTIKDQYDAYMDSASDEYKELAAMTWLGGEENDDYYVSEEDYPDDYITTENLDYVKVPAHGNQLFIRLKWNGVGYIFMNVPPKRYSSLKEKGNIVVEIYYQEVNGRKIVLDITEKEI